MNPIELDIIICIDALQGLKGLPDKSVHCIVTSPPYWGLRNYGIAGQLGMEHTPEKYIAAMAAVFTEALRVLADDGTLWLNIADTYYGGKGSNGASVAWPGSTATLNRKALMATSPGEIRPNDRKLDGYKPKDLIGIPWMLAFALRSAGYYLRQDIIWQKPNPMPESITDRCTKAHEYIFLFSKSAHYFYDAAAIAEPVSHDPEASRNRWDTKDYTAPGQKPQKRVNRSGNLARKNGSDRGCPDGTGSNICGSIPWEGSTRNKRSVWTISTKPLKEAHFATFPEEIPHTCISAGCPAGGIVLDPFMGAGTTAIVAKKLGRHYIGFELNPDYIKIAERRLQQELGLFNTHQSKTA